MSIWKEEISLELIHERGRNTAAEYLGVEFTEIGDDYVKATLPVDHRTVQPLGLLNGGMSCFLIETAASTAANYCVDQSEAFAVGLELNANHIRGVGNGLVTAVAKAVHLGRTTQVWQVDLFNEEEKLVCTGRMTMSVVRRPR